MPKAIEAVWKIESTRLIAAIAPVTHDIGIAEELAVVACSYKSTKKSPGDLNFISSALETLWSTRWTR